MSISQSEKNQIRTILLLELNSCFVKVSKHYKEHGNDPQREFLQHLIGELKDCVSGKAGERLIAESATLEHPPSKEG